MKITVEFAEQVQRGMLEELNRLEAFFGFLPGSRFIEIKVPKIDRNVIGACIRTSGCFDVEVYVSFIADGHAKQEKIFTRLYPGQVDDARVLHNARQDALRYGATLLLCDEFLSRFATPVWQIRKF